MSDAQPDTVPSPCGDPDHVLAADGLPCEKSQKHDIDDESLERVRAQRQEERAW